MIVAAQKETHPQERRVALIPASVPLLTKMGVDVVVQSSAGEAAGFLDSEYCNKGAQIVADRDELFQADVILQVRSLGANLEVGQADLERMHEGQTLLGMCNPLGAAETVRKLAQRRVTQFSLELLPRITRAQSMDVLSSMATVTGYKAVLLAANQLPRMFPMMMTAAGTITAAKVFVIGAGVAGLQAIASARRLGAVVQGYDVRPAVKEQVESLGAKFVELSLETSEAEGLGGYAKALGEDFYQKQRALLAQVLVDSDVCITTAAIPGKRSPQLITADAVRDMRPGSVIVDLAAEQGGNCELTQPDQLTVEHGVMILGPTNLPAEVPYHASQMYAKNLVAFLGHLVQDGQLHLDMNDEITRETLVTQNGNVVHEKIREILGLKSITCRVPSDARANETGILLDDAVNDEQENPNI